MNPLGLLFYLESRDIQLRPAGEGIHFRAPGGILSDSLKQLVREHKLDLVVVMLGGPKLVPNFPGPLWCPSINLYKSLNLQDLNWRPQGDLNPCRRRERAVS